MSVIFAPQIAQNGVLALNVGTGAPVNPVFCQGLLLDDAGAIYATTSGPATVFHQGLPFDSNGRLYVEDAAPVAYSQAIPFTANGALAISGDPSGSHYSQGLQIAASGGIVSTGGATPFTGKLLLYTLGGNGVEAWNTEVSPFTQVSALNEFNDSTALGISHCLATQKLAITGTQLQVYDTSVFPFVLEQEIALPAGQYSWCKWSPDGSLLGIGPVTSGPIMLVDTSDYSYVTVFTAACDGIAFNSASTRMAFACSNTVASGAMRCYDVTDPTSPVYFYVGAGAEGTVYAGCAIHPVHDFLFGNFPSQLDIYQWDINTEAFIRIFDPNVTIGQLAFALNGSRFGRLQLATNALAIYNSVSSDSSTWSSIPFDAGQNATMLATDSTRFGLSLSPDGALAAIWQTVNTSDDRRICWDISVNPIVRVPSFDLGLNTFAQSEFVYASI